MKTTSHQSNKEIERLRELVSQKFNFGDVDLWGHYQYEELSAQIMQTSGVLISQNTLKRFFGRIKSKSTASKSTLNALAVFCGFESYYDFVQKEVAKTSKPTISNREVTTIWKVVFIALLILASAIFLVRFFIKQNKIEKVITNAKIQQAVNEGYVPFTQIFKYKVDANLADTIHFQEFDKDLIALSTKDSVFSYMHFVPGYRVAKFMVDGQTIWNTEYKVNSKGWLAVYPWGGLEPRKYIPLEEGESIGLTEKQMLKHNIDFSLPEDNGWISYFNMQNFKASGEDFELQTIIKNQLNTGSQQCQDAIISVECQDYLYNVHFTQFGCQKFADIEVGKTKLYGDKNDFSDLALDMNQWNQIKLAVKKRNFFIEVAGKKVFETPIKGTPGKVTGLHFRFRGTGNIKYAAIKNAENAIVFEDGNPESPSQKQFHAVSEKE